MPFTTPEPRRATYDTVIIGAGQAGLAASYFLKRRGVAHVVLERGRIAETWRSQRWDSFALNTPNWLNSLPGATYDGPSPDGFDSHLELAQSFDAYVRRFALPVRERTAVTAVRAAGSGFAVRLRGADGQEETLAARNVVVASGVLRQARVPGFARHLPAGIAQIHSSAYRNPDALPDGATVVVGSGQSGSQIAEDLVRAGRRVYLCTSKVGRIPRRYRGRDIDAWLWDAGDFDVTPDDLEDPNACRATQPQVSGIGRFGHTLSLQKLYCDGVTLFGRLAGIEDTTLFFGDDLVEHIRFADEKSAAVKRAVDDYIAAAGIEAPAPEHDPADEPWQHADKLQPRRRLDLAKADVGSVIWCTGFRADFSWIDLPVLDTDGRPLHERGVSPVPGLYFLGFPWLYKRKSGIVCGVAEDAAYVAARIAGAATAAA